MTEPTTTTVSVEKPDSTTKTEPTISTINVTTEFNFTSTKEQSVRTTTTSVTVQSNSEVPPTTKPTENAKTNTSSGKKKFILHVWVKKHKR